MNKELILSRLATADHIYGYMYGQPYINTGVEYKWDKIIKIKTSDLIIGKNSLVYVWGFPGPDANIYYFSDYGITWAFDRSKIKYITLEEWKKRRPNMNHQEALADYLKFKQKVMPTIEEDSTPISAYFTEQERNKISDIFQDHYLMGINEIAEEDEVCKTLFQKVGIL